ncbi:MAG: class I SAM-dependent methyltransferase [Proteobacteria bacterium]|nr:class I SAM-dependent methyltransferase [Pseudomonadota bacterium]MBU1688984.1 class I SAM-dependent methyltransferase [Pseudomonadota bacterium]
MFEFAHIREEVSRKFRDFAKNNPEIISLHHVIQKLIIFDFVAPIVEKHIHNSILEIGSGLGFHSALLSHYGRVSATDLDTPGSFVGSGGNVNDIRYSILQELANSLVTCSNHDGRHLPYEDCSFDLVFHNSVIEHVPDAILFNREVYRVLRPGGICICITGTPVLCCFRLFKDYILKLPIHLIVAIIREVPILKKLALTFMKMLGKSEEKFDRICFKLQRLDARIRFLRSNESSVRCKSSCRNKMLGKFYARIFHYIYFPNYNRLVVEEIAKELGLSVDELLFCLEDHFSSVKNRFLFSLTPHTHGQHYQNVWHEMREWRIPRWKDQFEQSGFNIEEIVGYRYHHVLEFTPSFAWDTALYSYAARWIHLMIKHQLFNPAFASEIIIVGKKKV